MEIEDHESGVMYDVILDQAQQKIYHLRMYLPDIAFVQYVFFRHELWGNFIQIF